MARKKKEIDVILERYEETKSAYKDFWKKAEESYGFVYGGKYQWYVDGSDKYYKDLKDAERPTLSINRIQAKLNLLDGYFLTTRYDIKFRPQQKKDQEIVDIANQLYKLVWYQIKGDTIEGEVFYNGIISGEHYFFIYPDYSKDIIRGDVGLCACSPWEVMFDPRAKRYDKTDAEYVFRSVWLPVETIKRRWPQKARQIDKLVKVLTIISTKGFEALKQSVHITHPYDRWRDALSRPYNIKANEGRIDEYWYKTWEKIEIIVDAITKKVIDENEIDKETLEIRKKAGDIEVLTRYIPKVRVKYLFGDIELSDEPSPWTKGELAKNFPFVPFTIYKIYLPTEKKYLIWGVVEVLKDVQKEINKRHSYLIEAMLNAPYSVLIYEDQTFTPESEEALSKKGFRPGMSLKTYPGKINNYKIENTVQFPVGLLELENLALKDADIVSPIIPPSGKVKSGSAMLQEERIMLTDKARIFNNFKETKILLARYLFNAIQQTYDYEKTFKAVDSDEEYTINQVVFATKQEPHPLTGSPVETVVRDEFGRPVIEKIVNDITNEALDFDIIATEVNASPSYRLAVANDLLKIIQTTPNPIFIKMLFEYLDLPSHIKKELEQQINAQTQQALQQQNLPQNIRQLQTPFKQGG